MAVREEQQDAIVSIRDLKKTYRTEDGDKLALHGIDLDIAQGDIYALSD